MILTRMQPLPHPSRWYFCCTYFHQNLVTQLFYLYCHSDIFSILIPPKSYILFKIRMLLYSFINITIFLFFLFLFTTFILFLLTHFNKTAHNLHQYRIWYLIDALNFFINIFFVKFLWLSFVIIDILLVISSLYIDIDISNIFWIPLFSCAWDAFNTIFLSSYPVSYYFFFFFCI